MSICPHCGERHPLKALFCPKTGEAIYTSNQDNSPVLETFPNSFKPETEQIASPTFQKPPKKGFSLPFLLIFVGIIIAFLGILGITITLLRDVPISIFQTERILPTSPERLSKSAIFTPTITLRRTQEENLVLASPTPSQDIATPMLVLTSTFSVTSSVEPTELPYFTRINPNDQAVLVVIPAGKFTMGSNSEVDPYFWGAESPRHEVILDEYMIYQTEVTNAMYQRCATEKKCPLPNQYKNRLIDDYYSNPQYANYPVIYVNWVSAQSYCQWAGGRLPTEAEWEKAARGDQDSRLFPWGNTAALASQANFCDSTCAQTQEDRTKNDGFQNTASVGSFPLGASPFGVLDMAGNVWEWVSDWFQPTYSSKSVENPIGPASSKYKTIRGGSWNNPSAGVRIVQRDGVKPDLSLDTLGFRCVMEVEP